MRETAVPHPLIHREKGNPCQTVTAEDRPLRAAVLRQKGIAPPKIGRISLIRKVRNGPAEAKHSGKEEYLAICKEKIQNISGCEAVMRHCIEEKGEKPIFQMETNRPDA